MKVDKQFKLCVAMSVAALAVFVWIDPARAGLNKHCYYEPVAGKHCCVDPDPPGIMCKGTPDASIEGSYCYTPVACCRGTADCVEVVDMDCCVALPDWWPATGGTCDGPPLLRCPGETFSSADDDGVNFSPADYDYEQATSSSTGMWGLLIAALVVVPAVPIVIARRRAARRE